MRVLLKQRGSLNKDKITLSQANALLIHRINTTLTDDMKVVVLVFCVVVGIFPSDAQDRDHQIVCQRLRQVAEDACAAHDFRKEVVIGPKEEKGDRGEPVVVDCKRIMQNIKQLHSQEIIAMVIIENAMIATIKKLNESIANLKEENRKRESCTGVFYEGKCFWFVRQRVTYAQGEAICSKTPDGRVAIIYDDENYQQIQVYIRLLITGSTTHYDAWLGLKIYPASGRVVTLPEETEAPFKKWLPGGYPTSISTYTNVVLQLREDPSSSSQGMWNYYPTYNAHGVLCEA